MQGSPEIWCFLRLRKKVATGVQDNEAVIDEKIRKHSRLENESFIRVSLALLRLAIYEMIYEKDIPLSVSINEVVDLAKKYGGSEDAPFINGVLGSVAKSWSRKMRNVYLGIDTSNYTTSTAVLHETDKKCGTTEKLLPRETGRIGITAK